MNEGGSPRPQLLVVAGPNGSGKTTWLSENQEHIGQLGLVRYLNPDQVARALSPGDVAQASVQAGREIIRLSLDLLSNRESFGFETTLAGHHAVNVMRQAQSAGYEITLVFVATGDPGINIQRVVERKAAGGHGIPEEDIVRRYRRSFDNLEAAMSCSVHVRLIDNTERHCPHEYARADWTQVEIDEPVPPFGRAAVAFLVFRAQQS